MAIPIFAFGAGSSLAGVLPMLPVHANWPNVAFPPDNKTFTSTITSTSHLTFISTPTYEVSDNDFSILAASPFTISSPKFWEGELAQGTIAVSGNEVIASPGPNTPVNLIVVLESPSFAVHADRIRKNRTLTPLHQKASLAAYADYLLTERARVVSDLKQRGLVQRVRQQFTYLINGLAVTARMEDKKRLADVPGVQAVYFDYQAEIKREESLPLIGAPSVWEMRDSHGHAVTGQGIRVAVIDSGIDYTHPDLGGCLGMGCKVVDGYDFVNDDTDPMDDNGHGTHVAGIVAGNGDTLGVAPDATLLAYKACNEWGVCDNSDIIAALERAADPDGDPLTNDQVDVINMSLGGPGTLDDPLAQATEQAVEQGMVVVAAAGNSGARGYETIESPGIVDQALTVGASDKQDALTYFTSRGPVNGYRIKPDILAPGQSISSTVIGNSYAAYDGTSMATPHVAGAVALLRQLHPDWRPSMYKAVLMNTATSLDYNPYEEGAGRVRAAEAASAEVLIEPSSLSLGLVNSQQAIWQTTRTITLTNLTTTTQNYQLAASNLYTGVQIALSTTSVTLAPDEAQRVTLTVEVDNAELPYPSEPPYAYHGDVLIHNGIRQSHVPYAFVKAARIEFIFDQPPSWLFIHDRGVADFTQSWPFPGVNPKVLLSPGTYDIVVYDIVIGKAERSPAYIVKEGVGISAHETMTVNISEEASHTVNLQVIDLDGQSVPISSNTRIQYFHYQNPELLNLWSMGWTPEYSKTKIRTSDISESYHYEIIPGAGFLSPKNGHKFDLFFELNGVYADRILSNDIRSFKRLSYHYSLPSMVQKILPIHWYWHHDSSHPVNGFATWLPSSFLSSPFEEVIYRPVLDSETAVFRLRSTEVFSSTGWGDDSPIRLSQTPYFETFANSFSASVQNSDCDPWGHTETYTFTDTFYVNMSPIHWAGTFRNGTNSVNIRAPWWLHDQWQSILFLGELNYTLSGVSGRIDEGEITIDSCPYYKSISVPAGPITFTLPYTGWLRGKPTAGLLLAEFDTTQADKNPPYITSLQIRDRNAPSDTISSNGQVHLSIEDDNELQNVSIAVDYNNGEGWRELHATQINDLFVADIPFVTASSESEVFVSLRVIGEDTSGNRLTNTMHSAFVMIDKRWKVYLPVLLKDMHYPP
jgi:subtilisin family serine protease